MKVIEEGWKKFYELVLAPIDAPEIQVSESRRAFYAGASHLFASIVNGSEHMSVDEQADALESMNRELLAFADEIRAEVLVEAGAVRGSA